MAKKRKGNPASLADPATLKPFADDLVQAIIETPKSSRNKYAYDPEQGIFALRKVLPEGMVFPHDFGFLPQTLAEDGDPIDVLLLMDVPAFSGCLIPARLIGVSWRASRWKISREASVGTRRTVARRRARTAP